ncbi:MAG: group II truncated hemoglobin [Gammaproteobacteria bacterium]
MSNTHILYGRGDATFQAVGKEAGVRRLVDTFYDIMQQEEAYRTIWDWHPDDIQLSRDKLFTFLCGWMGGPARYAELYAPINIPAAHAHLSVGVKERDMWLDCMYTAMQQLDLPKELTAYLYTQFFRPAEMIRKTSQQRSSTT